MGRGRTTRAHSPARPMPDGPLVVYGVNPVLELLRSDAPVSRLRLGPGPRRAEVEAAARARGVRVESVDWGALERDAGSPHHQGVVATTPAFRYVSLETLGSSDRGPVLLLDGVQDPRNLGAILRSARATGAGGVVLPRDRSAHVTSVVVAASAGTAFGLSVALVPNLARAMESLKESGFWLIGLAPEGTPLPDLVLPGRPALVVGGEGEGLRPLVRRACDLMAGIPMAPGVDSLNVSVAVGIALYELLVRRRPR